MKKVEELGRKVSDMFMEAPDPTTLGQIVRGINVELDRLAKEISGVRADELSDENQESKPIVLLFWQIRSELIAKVLHEAAAQQTYYKELDR
jgi:hypothetical protein